MRVRTAVGIACAVGAGAGVIMAGRAFERARRRIDLRGRVVVITGGGRGLGYAIAQEFARHGCCLALCGRDPDPVRRAATVFRSQGVDAVGMPCDTSDPAQVHDFIESTLTRFGRIDVLVNNAGQCFVGPAAELEDRDVEYAMRNIFWVQYQPTMAVLPSMRAAGFGRIVNITSIGGLVPTPHQAAYTAGKFAATGWSETLALELEKDGILVSTVAPPPLRDGAPLHVHFNGRLDDEFTWFTKTLTSPWTASTAQHTARVVVDAARHGDFRRTVSFGTWLATAAHGIAPGLLKGVLTRTDSRLPEPAAPGYRSRMRLGSEIAAFSAQPQVRALAAKAGLDEVGLLPP